MAQIRVCIQLIANQRRQQDPDSDIQAGRKDGHRYIAFGNFLNDTKRRQPVEQEKDRHLKDNAHQSPNNKVPDIHRMKSRRCDDNHQSQNFSAQIIGRRFSRPRFYRIRSFRPFPD